RPSPRPGRTRCVDPLSPRVYQRDMAGRRWTMTVTVALVAGLSGAGGAAAAVGSGSAAGTGEINALAGQQISALQHIKETLTPAERKMDSRLVVAERQRANKSATSAVPKLRT